MSASAHHNLYAALRQAFPADLDRVAVQAFDASGRELAYSWRDLDRASAMMANLLAALDLPRGARVVAQVDKSVEAMLLYLAVLRAGLVYVPLNTAYQRSELAYFLEDASPAVVVCPTRCFAWLSKLAFQHGAVHVFTLDEDRTGTLLDRSGDHDDHQEPVAVEPDALASMIYTSGTTGRSKGAMLSHENLLSNARVLQGYWNWQPEDVLLHALPIFHVHGLFVAIHGALINGSPMLWMSRFEPGQAIGLMSRATVFMGVPTLYVRMLAEPALTLEAVRAMRLFISGSAPLLIETFRAWQERTGHTILERYGMSETVMLTSNPCLPDARHGGLTERRGGTVGFPLPGVSLRVVDDRGVPLSHKEVGNLEVKGPSVFSGYWHMPDKTADAFTTDGYFRTGDVGVIDDDGYVTIVGRSKDLIISGGYNVYPAEIEAELNGLPEVLESAVVGVPHPDFGEVGVALLVARGSASPQTERVLGALKERLANYKVPKHCEVLPELPRNAMGKVQKAELRRRFQHLFMPAS